MQATLAPNTREATDTIHRGRRALFTRRLQQTKVTNDIADKWIFSALMHLALSEGEAGLHLPAMNGAVTCGVKPTSQPKHKWSNCTWTRPISNAGRGLTTPTPVSWPQT